jgi:YidC/Oxa1 family membrane protein insertase
VADSTQLAKLQSVLGNFAYSATLPSAKNATTIIENNLVILTIANKGGYIVDAKLKKFEKNKKGSGQLVSLISNNNAGLNLKLQTTDNRILDTKNLFFEPTISAVGTDKVLSMKLKSGPDNYLEYKYTLKADDYLIGFDIDSKGLKSTLNTSKPVSLEWDLKSFRNEKSVSYENRYTEMYYGHNEGKSDYLGQSTDDTKTPEKVNYVAFKQHFFTSILVSDKPFVTSNLYSTNLVNDEKVDTIFTKQFKATLPLTFENGELNQKMHWYYGPSDYKTLKKADKNIEDTVSLGWGIFGWINRHVFIPVFDFISGFMGIGLAIIIFTILVKLLMSPVTYKSFLSQAKMKVLRPDIADLNEKFKKDPMKKQQETIKLYNKAGVNLMAGCIPALIQMPIFYALFQFFPSSLALRQESFLWASDLSSYDAVFKLPFNIPGYGNHVSLFPILASIAIFFYMKMTTGDQQMRAPQQEGMPDMGKIMKAMIYISPLMMLFFFNNYAAGLSLYNFISNLITIVIMLVIKNYIVDNDKIHAQIQENKSKEPKKQGKFQTKMQQLMEQAEAQKALKNKK